MLSELGLVDRKKLTKLGLADHMVLMSTSSDEQTLAAHRRGRFELRTETNPSLATPSQIRCCDGYLRRGQSRLHASTPTDSDHSRLQPPTAYSLRPFTPAASDRL